MSINLNLFALSQNVVGQFDYYVLAYSWTPEFCYDNYDSYPGCSKPQSFWGKYFTLHGLWPQYMSGGYPLSCSSEAFNTAVPNEIGMSTMTQYWPNVKAEEGSPNYDDFWEHEWSKHGTCTGLSQLDYFNTTINLIQKFGTPTQYTQAVGGTIDANTLRSYFGGPSYVTLQCDSAKYVSGIFTCWSQKNGYPNGQIECASDVQKEDTCTESTLHVTSF